MRARTILDRLRRGVLPEVAISAKPDRTVSLRSDRRRAKERRARHLLDWDEILRLHLEERLDPPKIAARTGASVHTIAKGLRQRGARRKPDRMPHRARLRDVWEVMHRRCEDERNDAYAHYGAKGVRVAKEWEGFHAFHRWALGAGYRPGLVLTRRAGTRLYRAANCRWVTREEADRASKLKSKPTYNSQWTLTAFGETKGPTAWSRDSRCLVTLTSLLRRLRSGWPPEDAIATPPRGGRGRADTPWVFITAFGTTKSLSDWTRDRRCKVTMTTVQARLRRGIPPERAIAAPPYRLQAPRA